MPEDHFIGLDVSARSVNLCAVDRDGKVVHEAKLASNPDDIARHVLALPFTVARIGLEAGMLSQHIFGGLAEAGLAVICIETRHMKAALAAQLNKTDRHDARGIAQMMRGSLSVRLKSINSTLSDRPGDHPTRAKPAAKSPPQTPPTSLPEITPRACVLGGATMQWPVAAAGRLGTGARVKAQTNLGAVDAGIAAR